MAKEKCLEANLDSKSELMTSGNLESTSDQFVKSHQMILANAWITAVLITIEYQNFH